jgi:hypothetical protein
VVLTASILLLASAGCGGPKVYPVQGKVVFENGDVLPGGWLIFEPLDENLKASATADIQSDGTFQLVTDGRAAGAMAGSYCVVITPPRMNSLDESKTQPAILHPKFRNRDTTPLKVEVKPDKNANHFTLVVEPP